MTPDSDFDPEGQLKKVHDVIEHPDKFSEVFCAALGTQVEMREKVKGIILELIKTNTEGRKTLKELICEVNKEDWKQFLKTTFGKFALGLWTILVILISVFINNLFTN